MTYLIVGFMLGVIFGLIIATIVQTEKPVGTLRVDRSDLDDGPYLFLELATDPRFIETQKRVVMLVDVKNYISQD